MKEELKEARTKDIEELFYNQRPDSADIVVNSSGDELSILEK